MAVNLRDIPNAFHLQRPNWDGIKAWVDAHFVEADQRDVWADIAGQWLSFLNEALGGRYETRRSEQVQLFAPATDAQAEPLLEYAQFADWRPSLTSSVTWRAQAGSDLS